MRRHNHLVQVQQLVSGRRRLLGKDIQRRSGNGATRERFVERVFVDETTTSAVDDSRALLHFADRVAIDEAACFRREWSMDREKICASIHLIERRQLNLEIASLLGCTEWLLGNDR